MDQPFIGFCVGGMGKQISINESKVKRAKQFFNDDGGISSLFSKPKPNVDKNILQSQSENFSQNDKASKQKQDSNGFC